VKRPAIRMYPVGLRGQLADCSALRRASAGRDSRGPPGPMRRRHGAVLLSNCTGRTQGAQGISGSDLSAYHPAFRYAPSGLRLLARMVKLTPRSGMGTGHVLAERATAGHDRGLGIEDRDHQHTAGLQAWARGTWYAGVQGGDSARPCLCGAHENIGSFDGLESTYNLHRCAPRSPLN
jgi:hypothetical protein